MLKVGVVGLGKMGISHLATLRAHPDVEVSGVCDSSGHVLSVLGKYTDLATFSDYSTMLADAELDAVVIATPTRFHSSMIDAAISRRLHVFCEKPLSLDPVESSRLAAMAEESDLVTQVGYHNKFVGSFAEVSRLLSVNAIGDVKHILAEAYGPALVKSQGNTWRSKHADGGGCLYEYAAHPIDLMLWYLGMPSSISGVSLDRIFSSETEDSVYCTMLFGEGVSGQLSVNWSDASQRKMTTKITIWGTRGRIFADRQECQTFLHEGSCIPDGYVSGWNVRYATDLTDPVSYYLRGEEYTAEIASFVQRVNKNETVGPSTFRAAARTDETLCAIAAGGRTALTLDSVADGSMGHIADIAKIRVRMKISWKCLWTQVRARVKTGIWNRQRAT